MLHHAHSLLLFLWVILKEEHSAFKRRDVSMDLDVTNQFVVFWFFLSYPLFTLSLIRILKAAVRRITSRDRICPFFFPHWLLKMWLATIKEWIFWQTVPLDWPPYNSGVPHITQPIQALSPVAHRYLPVTKEVNRRDLNGLQRASQRTVSKPYSFFFFFFP